MDNIIKINSERLLFINEISYITYDLNTIDRNKYIGFVYVTVNKVNGKMYIGQHVRWNKNYLGSGINIARAIKKHGRESFERHIIYLAQTQHELDIMEEHFIVKFNAVKNNKWYNICDGAAGRGNSFAGKTEKEMKEISRKMSNARMGDKNPMWGRYGEKPHMFGKTGEKAHNKKSVYLIDNLGSIIKKFKLVKEIYGDWRKDFPTPHGCKIIARCLSKQLPFHGYYLIHADKYEEFLANLKLR